MSCSLPPLRAVGAQWAFLDTFRRVWTRIAAGSPSACRVATWTPSGPTAFLADILYITVSTSWSCTGGR
eukprot:6712911-Heterocapsa_arctica.AAC.1